MEQRGFTIMELLIAIAVVAILAAALATTYEGWQGKYRVEKQVKEIYVDMMNAVQRSMHHNRSHFIDFMSATSYSVYEDTNPGPDGNGTLQTTAPADTRLPSFPKTLDYAVTIGTTGPVTTFTVNRRGLNTLLRTICIFTDVDGNGVSDYDPDYDCIVVSDTRINIGKLTTQVAAQCNATKCDTK